MTQTTSELGPAAAAIATHCRLLHAVTKYNTTSPSPSDRLRWTSAVLPLIPRSHCAWPTPNLWQATLPQGGIWEEGTEALDTRPNDPLTTQFKLIYRPMRFINGTLAQVYAGSVRVCDRDAPELFLPQDPRHFIVGPIRIV